jgi:hypothetical protein
MNFSVLKWCAPVFVCLGLAVLPTAARADFELLLYDNMGHSVDLVGSGGLVSFSGALGNFSVNVTTGTSKPLVGGLNKAEIDLNSVNVTSQGSGGNLTIVLADTGFTSPVGPATLDSSVGGTVAPGSGNSFTFQSWANNSNLSPLPASTFVAPPGSITPGLQGPFLPTAFSSDISTPITASSNFSLFSEAVINLTGGGETVSFDGFTTVTTPAPGAIVLALSGLPILGLGWWKGRRLVKA